LPALPARAAARGALGEKAGDCAFHGRQDVFHGSSTMVRLQLDERQWKKLEVALAAEKRRGRPGRDDRNFMEAVLWWRRTGAPWRDLHTSSRS